MSSEQTVEIGMTRRGKYTLPMVLLLATKVLAVWLRQLEK